MLIDGGTEAYGCDGVRIYVPVRQHINACISLTRERICEFSLNAPVARWAHLFFFMPTLNTNE